MKHLSLKALICIVPPTPFVFDARNRNEVFIVVRTVAQKENYFHRAVAVELFYLFLPVLEKNVIRANFVCSCRKF